MKSVALTVFPRSLSKRSGVKQLRSRSRVPAVIYGGKSAAQNLELKLTDIEDLIHHSASENVLVDLAVEGDARAQRLALVQAVQHHPLSGKVLHVDFHEIVETEKVTVTVPVEAVGEAIGVKNGGVLEHVLFKIKIRGLIKDIPEIINVDVTALEIGKAVHLGELPLPAGVEALGEKGIPVIACAAPVTEAQEQAAEAAATTAAGEPEMIKEKKEEGAVEGAPAGAKPAAGAAKAAEKPAAGDKKPAATEKKAEKKK